MFTYLKVRTQSLVSRLSKEDGVTAAEYGLIAALAAVAIIVALTALAWGLNNIFNYIATQLNTATQ